MSSWSAEPRSKSWLITTDWGIPSTTMSGRALPRDPRPLITIEDPLPGSPEKDMISNPVTFPASASSAETAPICLESTISIFTLELATSRCATLESGSVFASAVTVISSSSYDSAESKTFRLVCPSRAISCGLYPITLNIMIASGLVTLRT